jgi:hypothetical protein
VNDQGSSLGIALKEWAVVCRALETGRQMVLLRKGGIHESSFGFELEHPKFLLFPTYLHQNLQMLKAEAHAGFEPHSAEPARITLSGVAEVTDIIRLKYRAQMDAIDAEHIWTAPLIDMRFSYRPENPLYLLLVRAYALSQPVTIENTPQYAGCKSWVPLAKPIDIPSPEPVLDDREYAAKRSRIVAAIKS